MHGPTEINNTGPEACAHARAEAEPAAAVPPLAGLRVGRETAAAMCDLSPLIAGLPAGRLQMELGALMAYGAAAGSVRLMWRFGVLDLLLVQHAVHLRVGGRAGGRAGPCVAGRLPLLPRRRCRARCCEASPGHAEGVHNPGPPFSRASPLPRPFCLQHQHVARNPRRPKPALLFDLLAALDGSEGVSPQQPVDPSAWIALLAAPLVAEECARLCSRAEVGAAAGGRGGLEGPGGRAAPLRTPSHQHLPSLF